MPILFAAYRRNNAVFSHFCFGKFKEQSIKFILGVETRVLSTSLSIYKAVYIYSCMQECNAEAKMSFKN
jgi:hypothetical protein